MPRETLKRVREIINKKRTGLSSSSVLGEIKSKLKKKKISEGFGPIYKDGKIAPGYEGLGPKFEKDLGPMKKMPQTPKRREKRQKTEPIRKLGKRYYV